MAEELEDKFSRFYRDTDIDLQAEIATGGSGELVNYYTKAESDEITDALDDRVTDLESAPPGGGVTDHGALTGLNDDDHPIYLNAARGDDRYYTKTQTDANYAQTVHTHNDLYYTESEINTQFANYYTQTATNTLLDGKSNTGHTHTKSEVGLANVDNTSDANKPVSSATQTALDAKVAKGTLVFNVKDYGALGNDTADDTTAIQSAITAATASKGIVFFPPGTYKIGTFTGTGVSKRALLAAPGVTLQGASREASIIKIAASAGDYASIVGPVTPSTNVEGFSVKDLTFDHNTTNNIVASPGTMVADNNIRASIIVYVSSRAVVQRCRFTNIDCVWQVAVYGDNTFVTDNVFDTYGTSSAFHDSSAIYTNGKNVQLTNNTLIGTAGSNGAITAIEIHGGKHVVNDNIISGFFNGINVTGIAAPDTIGVTVNGNTITQCSTGIQLWSSTYTGNNSGWGLQDVAITGNTIEIDYDTWNGIANTAAGIMLDPTSNLGLRNIKIASNVITWRTIAETPTSQDFRNAGIVWYRPGSPTGLTDTNIEIHNNQISGPVGPGLYLQPKAIMRSLKIADNTVINPASGGGAAYDSSYRTGIKIAQSQDSFDGLYLVGNTVIDNRATGIVTSAIDLVHLTVAVTDGQAIDNVLKVTDAASTAVDLKPSATASAAFNAYRSRATTPGVIPNAAYYFGPAGSRLAITSCTQSAEYAVPVYLAAGAVITRLGCQNNAQVASTVVRLGIRADKNGLPGSLLLDAGTVDVNVAANTALEITGLNLRLAPGLYWFTATSQGGIANMHGTSGDLWPVAGATLAAATGGTACTGYITAATVTGALPSTYTVSNRVGVAPRVVARHN